MNFRLNGFGTWLLGPEPTTNPGEWIATRWITALFIPIIPLARYRVQVTGPQKKGQPTLITAKERLPLSIRSIVKTYLFGILIVPVLVLGPAFLAITEVQTYLGIPKDAQPILLVLAVCWIIGAVWKLKDWEENRWTKAPRKTIQSP